MNSIQKVNKVCKLIKGLTPEDLDAVQKMAYEQFHYIHPLKGAKQTKLNELGQYNIMVVSGLRKLKEMIDTLPDKT